MSAWLVPLTLVNQPLTATARRATRRRGRDRTTARSRGLRGGGGPGAGELRVPGLGRGAPRGAAEVRDRRGAGEAEGRAAKRWEGSGKSGSLGVRLGGEVLSRSGTFPSN